MRAHPRAGGENVEKLLSGVGDFGSSPRGRGKPARRRRRHRRGRLIPARAGKTKDGAGDTSDQRAHPRAGGENEVDSLLGVQPYGSSPRGRGKLNRRRHGPRRHGLIPARAGKTAIGVASRYVRSAHPRAGGENVSVASGVAETVGSSPRGRGKLGMKVSLSAAVRLIPARAGKTIMRGT